MKTKEILKSVLFMGDVECGMFTTGDDVIQSLVEKFGDTDFEDENGGTWIEGMKPNTQYFYSFDPLCSEETLAKGGEQTCYPVSYLYERMDGQEINIYDMED